MALYTGKGDGGTTYLFDTPKGTRISKASFEIEALGTLDELNSFLGLCKVESVKHNVVLKTGQGSVAVVDIAHLLQEHLFIVQAEVAGADQKIHSEKVSLIEGWVQDIEKELPPITTFFISGGTELAARFDVARTLARRAERTIVALVQNTERTVSSDTLAYLNRLSSILYALARYSNYILGEQEIAPSYR
jgi:cob(I)alamin adenosyltransferase